jgi:hypothetical protein
MGAELEGSIGPDDNDVNRKDCVDEGISDEFIDSVWHMDVPPFSVT